MSTPVYKLSEKALYTAVGEDIVALNVNDGQCYGMAEVTAAVWRMLETPMGIADICERLIAFYAVDPQICRADVDQLFQQLLSEGLVEEAALQA